MDDSNPLGTSETPPRVIAGFWTRVFGVFIDSLILGAGGLFLGFLFSEVFMQMGQWGRIVGFLIALLYFGFMNSRIFGGQTLGKRVAKTRVVNRNGEPLGLVKSFSRYAILGAPFFLNNSHLPPQLLASWIGTLFSVLVFGFGSSIIYLIIFNRRTRQSLHDLIAGSYVVKSGVLSQRVTIKMWKGHYLVVVVVLLASLVLPSFLFAKFGNSDFFKTLLSLQQKIMEEPEVSYAGVIEGQRFFSSPSTGTKKTTNLAITVFLKARVPDQEILANKTVEIAFQNHPRALQKDSVSVNLVYGYDIGIWWSWRSHGYRYSPQEWEKRLRRKASNAS
jgi:uncharacterized RDD family membrane protein YckC